MRLTLVALLCLAAAGCTTRSASVITPYLPNLLNERPAIIFIHGFYGSALREKDMGKRIFLTGKEALFGKSALSLFQAELGTPPGPPLEVEGLLGTVPEVPGLYEVDVYSSFIRELRARHPQSQVLALVFDWRSDLFLAVEQLAELVRLLREKGAPSISLMAHSAGGQVAAYYLGYGAQSPEKAQLNWEGAKHVQKMVFFGVPFGGSMTAFRSFEKGSKIPKTERMLSADSMASFPSLYQLLSPVVSVLDKAEASTSLSLFDAELWHKHRFGLLRRQELAPFFLDSRSAFTRENLRRAQRWAELLQLGRTADWPCPPHLKVMNVVSASHSTLDLAYFDPTSRTLLFDENELAALGLKPASFHRQGDGSVTRSSAEVPPSLAASTQVVSSSFAHEKLFLDPEVESEYNGFLASPK